MKWLQSRLKQWERERYIAALNRLEEENRRLRQQCEVKDAYIAGIQESLKAVRKIKVGSAYENSNGL